MIGEQRIGQTSLEMFLDKDNRMINDAFNELIELIDKYPTLRNFGGPLNERIVHAVEKHLEVQFPQSYRGFISRYAQGSFHGIEVSGISTLSTEHNLIGGVILDNYNFRHDERGPKELLVVMLEDEYYVVIDTSQMKDGEAPVYEIDFGEDFEMSNKEPVAASFAEYYLRQVKEMVEYLKEQGRI